MDVRFLPAGDAALVIEFGDRIDRALSERALRLSDRIRAARIAGVIESVPTFRSLMLHYDPVVTSAALLSEQLHVLIEADNPEQRRRRLWRIPACYDESCAPDLAEVAQRSGLTPAEVVTRHAGTRFYVYMIGFVPGYAYMGDLPAELQLSRRVDPRVRVPPGSLAIAQALTTVYPLESPGGWHLIGATPIRLFDPYWPEPSLLAPGDQVEFAAIGLDEYAAIKAAVAADSFVLEPESIAA